MAPAAAEFWEMNAHDVAFFQANPTRNWHLRWACQFERNQIGAEPTDRVIVVSQRSPDARWVLNLRDDVLDPADSDENGARIAAYANANLVARDAAPAGGAA